MIKVLSIFGTRPEAIKMAPVVKELAKKDGMIISRVCVTAQHRQMLDQVLGLFDIKPDYDLNIMQESQTLSQLTANVLSQLEPILRQEKPDWVLVQGDTSTAMAASIAAFYAHIKVGHIEAGLRTFDKWHPFPEEMNRKITGLVSDLHFAPTEASRNNLLREGVDPSTVTVTGNPVIDAFQMIAHRPYDARNDPVKDISTGKRIILVTAHRRENFGKPLVEICGALQEIAERYMDVQIVYPVHLNPDVREPVYRLLGKIPNIILLSPLDYFPFVQLMKRAYLVLTDSGGIQEEAPCLGKPVLVLRDVTERPEAVAAGTARIVGTDRKRIVAETICLLENNLAYNQMAQASNPYGDGLAAERIVSVLCGEKVAPFTGAKVFFNPPMVETTL
jgi:UDP-N-acetylglucosamine 2-epimerase (non-hydrolysing)